MKSRVIAVVLLAAIAAGLGVWWLVAALTGGSTPTTHEDRLAVFSDTRAAHHASVDPAGSPEREAARLLAAVPTAFWLVPERDPIDAVAQRVTSLAHEAAHQNAQSTIVVYGLPGRDCGNHSSGGLDEPDYAVWTAQIGEAIRSAAVATTVILEPDAIALSNECGDVDARAAHLQTAVRNLTSEYATIYIDGGHSGWHDADRMAQLIQRMGVIDDVRGFATNVSNFNTDRDETAYAHELARALGGTTHAVIDTGRSGAGSDGQWCNPPDRRIGSAPGTFGDAVVDTNLWIKAPGESDGECNGGPVAGQWWPQAAVELTLGMEESP